MKTIEIKAEISRQSEIATAVMGMLDKSPMNIFEISEKTGINYEEVSRMLQNMREMGVVARYEGTDSAWVYKLA